jgi:hypothetical protein
MLTAAGTNGGAATGVCLTATASASSSASDAVALNGAGQVVTACPVASTGTVAPSPPPHSSPLTGLTTAVSNPSRATTAATNLANCLIVLKTQTDPITGINQAALVSVIVVGVSSPTNNGDGSYSLTITVTFVPVAGNTVGVTDDIRRVHEPCLANFSNDLSGVKCDGTVKWTPNVKRAISQGSAETDNAATTMPGGNVQAVYGASTSSAVFATLGLLFVSLIALFM